MTIQSAGIQIINTLLDGLTLDSQSLSARRQIWAIIAALQLLKWLTQISNGLAKFIYRILCGTCLEPIHGLCFLTLGLLAFIFYLDQYSRLRAVSPTRGHLVMSEDILVLPTGDRECELLLNILLFTE